MEKVKRSISKMIYWSWIFKGREAGKYIHMLLQSSLGNSRCTSSVLCRITQFLKLFVFNWSIIALQCYVDFCRTCTSLPPHTIPLGCHSTGLSSLQSYSKFPLAMPLSQFVSPSPSTAGSTNLFSTSVSLLMPYK